MRSKAVALFILSIIVTTALAYSLPVAERNNLPQRRRSVWSGVYTTAQASRGKAEYDKYCIRCHANNLDGVADANLLGDFSPRVSLRGTDFMERWREDTVQSLYTLILEGMPPRTEPGATHVTLSEAASLDLVAHILQGNDFPAGDTELNPSELRNIRIQEKEGTKPLPSFSTIQVVGCLTQLKPGVWQLSMAGEPIRIRQLSEPTEEDLRASAAEPFGLQEYDLQNLGYLGRDFVALNHENHKMMARGILIRQPPTVRIDIRAFVEVAPNCDQ